MIGAQGALHRCFQRVTRRPVWLRKTNHVGEKWTKRMKKRLGADCGRP